MKTITESFEQAVTAACTRALECGRARVKLPAAVVRSLMTELHYHRTQDEGWRAFAEKRGKTIIELREQLEDATIKAKDRYEGMVTLTKMINKMSEAVEKAETRATAAEADVREMADAIRDLRDRVAAAEAKLGEYDKSFRAQEVIVHNARNEALELGRKLDAAEEATVAAKKETQLLDDFIRETVKDWQSKQIAWIEKRGNRK